MAFTTITTAEIAVGEPVKNSTLVKIKDDLDYLNDSLSDIVAGTVVTPSITLSVNGVYVNYVTTGLLKTTTNFALTITNVFILIDVAGGSGTTEIDIQKMQGASVIGSIFTTKPSVAFGVGNGGVSSNAVLHGTNKILVAGDILRLDITSAQNLTARNFMVRIDYTKT